MADRIVIVTMIVGVVLMLTFVPRDAARRMSPDVTLVAEQSAQQGTSLGAAPVSPVVQRSIRFVCNQQTLPNDIASCMNRAVRVYFEGNWSGADICNGNGEACADLKTLLTPKGRP